MASRDIAEPTIIPTFSTNKTAEQIQAFEDDMGAITTDGYESGDIPEHGDIDYIGWNLSKWIAWIRQNLKFNVSEITSIISTYTRKVDDNTAGCETGEAHADDICPTMDYRVNRKLANLEDTVIPSYDAISLVDFGKLDSVDKSIDRRVDSKVTDALQSVTDQFSTVVGSITMFAGVINTDVIPITGVPDDYLLCNGDEVLIDDYPDLADVIGEQYGNPTDPTKFQLPDFVGRMPIGTGQMSNGGETYIYANGDAEGEARHKLEIAEMPIHKHTSYDNNGTGAGEGFPSSALDNSGHYAASYDTNRPSGGDIPHENRPPYLSLNFIIKAK